MPPASELSLAGGILLNHKDLEDFKEKDFLL